MDKNPLLTMLRVVDSLNKSDITAADLMLKHGLTGITLKRYIRDAKSMGADIVSVKCDGKSYYHLNNYANIKKILNKWIELEEKRSFIDFENDVLFI